MAEQSTTIFKQGIDVVGDLTSFGDHATHTINYAEPVYETLLHMNGNITDSLSNYTWTLTGSSTYNASAKFGSNSLELSNGDYISTNIDLSNGNWSIDFWVSMEVRPSAGNVGDLLSAGTGIDGTDGFSLLFNDSGNFILKTSNGNSVTTSSSYGTGFFYHVVVQRNGGELELYVQGSLKETLDISGHNIEPNTIIRLGNSNATGTVASTSYYDELRVITNAIAYEDPYTRQSTEYSNTLPFSGGEKTLLSITSTISNSQSVFHTTGFLVDNTNYDFGSGPGSAKSEFYTDDFRVQTERDLQMVNYGVEPLSLIAYGNDLYLESSETARLYSFGVGGVLINTWDSNITIDAGFVTSASVLVDSLNLDLTETDMTVKVPVTFNDTLTVTGTLDLDNGNITGPATITIDPAAIGDNTGKVVIAGDLQVDGTTTTINSSTLTVDDLNIVVASGAVDSAAANGGGLTIDGADASITWNNANSRLDLNKKIAISDADAELLQLTRTASSQNVVIGFTNDITTTYLGIGAANGEIKIGTAANVLSSGNRLLTTADEGTGNGLDADTVDGYHAAEAATVSTIAARDSSGNLTVNDITVDGILLTDSADRSGLLEINRLGTTTWSGTQTKFSATALWSMMGHETQFGLHDDVNGDWALRYTKNAQVELNYNGATKLETAVDGIDVTGEIRATGDITAFFSDGRLKDFHGTIPNALDKVNTLSGYYYEANQTAFDLGITSNGVSVGLNAQEVESVLPEVVTLAPFDRDQYGKSISGEDYKTIKYERIVALLIESIKELNGKVDELTEQLNQLKS